MRNVVAWMLLGAAACASPESAPQASTPPQAPTPPPASTPPPAPTPNADDPCARGCVYAKTRFVWVHYEPSVSSGWFGYLWLGGHAELASETPVYGTGCEKWYAVKPRGFVCVDGDGATLDPNDPVLVAMKPYAPDLTSPWPHRYAESRMAERYDHLPTETEQRAREWDLDKHMADVAAAREGNVTKELEGVDLEPGGDAPFFLPPIPSTMREQRRRMLPLSTVAWSREIATPGRTFLLTADFAYVPKDRVAPYPISSFHGTPLGEVRLPLAFFREKSRPKYRETEDGTFVVEATRWERLDFVPLSGKSKRVSEKTYWETSDGFWTDAADATIVTPKAAPPYPDGASGRRSWIEVSILGGWLIAYENGAPVYATLVSPGRGGVPQRDVDPLVTASTPIGTWPITGKFATATMVAPGEFVHSDVPWTQNFHGPHALHAAYWHDGWGEKKSAGCINLSPIDGKWLFEWTDPKVPDGWHGVRFDPSNGTATRVVVHD